MALLGRQVTSSAHGILCLGGRRVIHYATEAAIDLKRCNKDIYLK